MRRILLYLFLFLLSACSKRELLDATIVADVGSAGSISDIFFLNDSTAFACGGRTYESCLFMRSTDAGKSWEADLSIPAKKMNVIRQAENGQLFMTGTDGLICQSDDSGRNWQVYNRSVWLTGNDIYARSADDLFLCTGPGEHKGRLLKYVPSSYGFAFRDSGQACYSISFADEQRAYLAVYGGVKKSTDGGESWTYTAAEGDVFICVKAFGADTVFAIGRFGLILRSTDGAASWQCLRQGNHLFGKMNYIEDVCFVNAREWWICGRDGLLWRTYDGGEHFDQLEVADEDFLSVAVKADKIFLGTYSGRIYRL